MKRIFSLLLIIALCLSAILSLSGCQLPGSGTNSGDNGANSGDNGTSSGDNGGSDGEPAPIVCPECGVGEITASVTPAGILTDGLKTFTCPQCSHSYTEVIPATKTLRFLFVGDASSQDAIKHLEPMLKEAGVESVTIATLNHNHSTGATVESQWKNIQSNKKAYTFTKTVNGERTIEYSKTFDEGLLAEDWDFIALGQSIYLGGYAESYANVADLVGHVNINKTNPDAKLLWSMGWALRSDCPNAAFAKHDNDQLKMFAHITEVIDGQIKELLDISAIVPVGTAVQNLRGSVLGDVFTNDGILLGGDCGDVSAYAASLLWCNALLGTEIGDVEWMPDHSTKREKDIYEMGREAAMSAAANNYEITPIEGKSMKLLIFGNSYGNDAMAYFGKILNDAGYVNVVIGHAGESSMAINDHAHNIDDDPDNDYIYKTGETFSVHYKTVNGVHVDLPADYKQIVANEDWDIITFYQGPNSMDTLTKESYYSELDYFVSTVRANMTNPDGKIIYYMPWAHGSTNTAGYHAKICALTDKLFSNNENIDGIIPAGTVIQNLRTSYLSSATDGTGDINRDWGHLNYGVGRYSIALLFYAYLTGGDIEDVTYIPTAEEISARPFTPIEPNLEVIREAVKCALEKPFELTQSTHTEKSN